MKQAEQQKEGQIQEQQKPMEQVSQDKQVNSQAEQPVKKKSKWWLWLIIALVVLGVAVAGYFIFLR